jgi:anti-sigma-K factor RskA
MKDRKEIDRELIHRMLDGDLGPDEKKVLLDRVQSDPALKEELDGITRALRTIETSERMQAPPFFTAEVMRRLPARKATIANRIRDFLLKGRVLKWNMATAFAAAVLFALVFTQVDRTRNAPVETAALSQQEQTVTVTMNLHAPEAHHVAVAGTFNKWKADTHILTRQENGVWTVSIPLKPGEYSYMFIVDGKAWVTDPNAETYRDDGFGNRNAVMRVRT